MQSRLGYAMLGRMYALWDMGAEGLTTFASLTHAQAFLFLSMRWSAVPEGLGRDRGLRGTGG